MSGPATTPAVRRASLGIALLLALPLLAQPAHAGDGEGSCWESLEAGPAPTAGVFVEHGTCEGESWTVAVNDPNGRSELRWYDDERGVGVEAHRPPRFVAWWSDAEGCHLILYVFGAEEIGCVAGAPPSPTRVSALLP